MSYYPKALRARRPRHEATPNDSCHVWLELPGAPDTRYEAELEDLSRQGAQVRLARSIPKGQAVFLHIQDEAAGLDVCLSGTIRWQHPLRDACAVGCVFEKEIDYAVMGELFLNGILDTGPAAAHE